MRPRDNAVLNRLLELASSADAEARRDFLRLLHQLRPETLADLADAAGHPANPVLVKAARSSMERIVHHACRPGGPRAERAAVATTLLEIARSGRPRLVRAHALRLLGFAGAKGQAATLAPLEKDREVGDDARMAAERLRRA